jgi:photosystem II stability/assembly factor-like uncharacterized protein
MIRITVKTTLATAFALLATSPAHALPAWERIGPEGGSICALAAAPSRPATLYAGGADGGGVFRSDDRGLTWRFAGGDLGTRPACSLAVDARTPSRAWAVAANQLFRTDDSGRRWLPLDRPGALPFLVVAHPTISGRLYAATDQGLRLSEDGGLTWSLVEGLSTEAIVEVVVDPQRPQHLFVSTYGGFFRSLDGGRSWKSIRPPTADSYAYVSQAALDLRDGQTLYAVLSNGVLYRSANAGGSWTRGPSGVGARDIAVAGKSLLVATDSGLLVSRNGGKSFAQDATRLRGQQVATLAAVPFGILAGSELGVFRSLDAAASFSFSQRGLRLRSWLGLEIDPEHPERWTALDGHENLLRSANGGGIWRRAAADLLDPNDLLFGPRFLALDPESSRFYSSYATMSGGGVLARSDEDGKTWRELARFGCLLPYSVLADAPRDRLWVSGAFLIGACGLQPGACAVHRSLDDGQTFSCAKDLPPEGAPVIAVHPPTGDLLASGPEGLLRSSDWGEHWTTVSTRHPVSLEISAADPDLFYGLFLPGGGHFELAWSEDRGVTWSAPLPTPPGDLYPDPFDAGRLFALSPQQLYVSEDHGATWQLAGAGNLEVTFNALAFDPARPGALFAASTGGGLMRLRLEP